MSCKITENVRWVWIDLDDTLIDFKANSLVALRLTYTDFALHCYFPSCEAWEECYMRHNHALWDRYNRAEITQDYLRMHRFLDPISENAPIDEATFAPTARLMDLRYLDHLADQRNMVDGAMTLVDFFRGKGYRTGVLSNGFHDVQHRKIHTVGLDSKIDLIVLSDDIGVNKPDPRIYRHAMERTGITEPSAHLMIGDNPDTDIAGAIHSGWRAILFDPKSRHQLTDTDNLITVASLHDIPPLF